MLYLLYISSAFIALQLFNVLLNFLFRQKIENTDRQNSCMLSVLIPARNEEANIGQLLEKLHNMKNEHVEIIVCDDHSEDKTIQIAREYCKKDPRIQLMLSDTLPTGWLGKNHACFQLAQKARGNYFLFVDADVRLHGNIL
ncbi:MAG TPA: glycosyltransferase family A protein, partial [Bacteroidales bacterium]